MKEVKKEHPKSLKVFFATEMWERYGFYVIQTLLTLYMVLKYRWPDKDVYELVGTFTALTYLSPLMGGWIADKLLGQRRAILLGAVVLLCSYVFLGLIINFRVLCFCLAGIVVGTGLLKPNISSLLGNEYPEDSPNRVSGFTIFYMGLTLGIVLGSTLPSYLYEKYGWSVAFLSASIGMFAAIGTFLYGTYYYQIQDYCPFRFSWRNILLALSSLLALWGMTFYILNYPILADVLFLCVVIASVTYIWRCVKKESSHQARQTLTLGVLCLISVVFWAFYFQMFTSLTLFISRVVSPTVFGVLFPPPFYVSIQSIGMIILGLLLSRVNPVLSPSQQTIRIGNKFLLAIGCMFIAYGLITVICHFNFPHGLLSPMYLIPAYLVISLAELLLSPVGLSAVTMLASRENVSTMMGIFFVSLGVGAFLSGKLAQITAVSTTITSIKLLKMHYAHSFSILLTILFVATLVCVLLNGLIPRLAKR